MVNRGGNTVREDDLFEVFALGDKLVDPDTGERSGPHLETTAGIARIMAVKPKFSLAEMITDHDGDCARHDPAALSRRCWARLPVQGARSGPRHAPTSDRNYRRIDSDGRRRRHARIT